MNDPRGSFPKVGRASGLLPGPGHRGPRSGGPHRTGRWEEGSMSEPLHGFAAVSPGICGPGDKRRSACATWLSPIDTGW